MFNKGCPSKRSKVKELGLLSWGSESKRHTFPTYPLCLPPQAGPVLWPTLASDAESKGFTSTCRSPPTLRTCWNQAACGGWKTKDGGERLSHPSHPRGAILDQISGLATRHVGGPAGPDVPKSPNLNDSRAWAHELNKWLLFRATYFPSGLLHSIIVAKDSWNTDKISWRNNR